MKSDFCFADKVLKARCVLQIFRISERDFQRRFEIKCLPFEIFSPLIPDTKSPLKSGHDIHPTRGAKDLHKRTRTQQEFFVSCADFVYSGRSPR